MNNLYHMNSLLNICYKSDKSRFLDSYKWCPAKKLRDNTILFMEYDDKSIRNVINSFGTALNGWLVWRLISISLKFLPWG